MEEGLIKNTGKNLAEWKKIVADSKLEKHGEIMKYLKGEHGMTHGFANFVSLKYRESDAGSIDDADLLKAQYEKKPDLLPLYEEINDFILSLGGDIKAVPKKDSVSYVRSKQFALVKPATKSRMDIGLKLKGVEPQGVLESSGPFGTMCTHRIQIPIESGINEETKEWIKKSYENN